MWRCLGDRSFIKTSVLLDNAIIGIPSLSKLAHVKVLQIAVESVETLDDKGMEGFRRKFLELPKELRDELFTAAFHNRHSNVVQTQLVNRGNVQHHLKLTHLYPASLLATLRSFGGYQYFRLWWCFFDPNSTKRFGVEVNDHIFSRMLMSSLKSIETCLEELIITYNWILLGDFKVLLDNMKNLKYLTVFASNCEDKVMKEINQSSCQLKSLKFKTSGKNASINLTDPGAVINFLENQIESLEELDTIGWFQDFTVENKNSIWNKVKQLKNVGKLSINCRDFQQQQNPEEKVQDLIQMLPTFKDLIIDCNSVGNVGYFGFLDWLIHLPKSIKITLVNVTMTWSEKSNDPFHPDLFANVIDAQVSIRTDKYYSPYMFMRLFPNINRFELVHQKKLKNIDFLDFLDTQPIAFNHLVDASLKLTDQEFPYEGFETILFTADKLEQLSFQRCDRIDAFKEKEFQDKIKARKKHFRLKFFELVDGNVQKRNLMPFQSLLQMIEKSPALIQITVNLPEEEQEQLKNKGFQRP